MDSQLWSDEYSGTLLELLDKVRSEPEDNRFLMFSEQPDLSYGEFARKVDAFGAGLLAIGVEAGDRVAALLDNSQEAMIAWFASVAIGVVYVPLNIGLKASFLC